MGIQQYVHWNAFVLITGGHHGRHIFEAWLDPAMLNPSFVLTTAISSCPAQNNPQIFLPASRFSFPMFGFLLWQDKALLPCQTKSGRPTLRSMQIGNIPSSGCCVWEAQMPEFAEDSVVLLSADFLALLHSHKWLCWGAQLEKEQPCKICSSTV